MKEKRVSRGEKCALEKGFEEKVGYLRKGIRKERSGGGTRTQKRWQKVSSKNAGTAKQKRRGGKGKGKAEARLKKKKKGGQKCPEREKENQKV